MFCTVLKQFELFLPSSNFRSQPFNHKTNQDETGDITSLPQLPDSAWQIGISLHFTETAQLTGNRKAKLEQEVSSWNWRLRPIEGAWRTKV